MRKESYSTFRFDFWNEYYPTSNWFRHPMSMNALIDTSCRALCGKHWPKPDVLPGYQGAFSNGYCASLDCMDQVYESIYAAAGFGGRVPPKENLARQERVGFMKVNQYPEIESDESGTAMVAHYDKLWCTLLYRSLAEDASSSLQIWDPETTDWYQLPSIGTAVTVFILGREAHEYFDGLYEPGLHRVMWHSGVRTSALLFSCHTIETPPLPQKLKNIARKVGRAFPPATKFNQPKSYFKYFRLLFIMILGLVNNLLRRLWELI